MVSEEGISTDAEKISDFEEWPVPTSVTQLRSFTGICAYYRRFIGSFSEKRKEPSLNGIKNVRQHLQKTRRG